MSDRILQQFASRVEGRSESGSPEDVESTDDFGAFGWLRNPHCRSLMLELRKKTGNSLAVGYSWLEKVLFDPSEGITLFLTGQKITIRGRNLNADSGGRAGLFQGITKHRVAWIQEADQPNLLQAGKTATVAEEIQW